MHSLDIETYIKEAEEIEKLYIELLKVTARERPDEKIICHVDSRSKPIQRETLRRYQVWYEICRRIVYTYADHEETANYEEFTDVHTEIVNLIDLNESSIITSPQKSTQTFLTKTFIKDFDTQVNILHTIKPIIAFTENNFKRIITADLLNSELDEAEMLYEREFIRPAGIIAGIVLERYLKMLCEMNEIELGPKDTLVPMAQKLRDSDKVPDFDLAMFKSINHLGTLRNKCAHPKEEPKEHEVRELLDKTKKITFMAFS